MASPTLSSPTLVAGTPIWSLNALPDISIPPPTASSRGFHVPRPPRKAHTEKMGFLHLPDNVRIKIYRLAIFDHDRGAVFLPRACPRKVQPGVDDLDAEEVDTSREKIVMRKDEKVFLIRPHYGYDGLAQPVQPSVLDGTAAAGRWTEDNHLMADLYGSIHAVGNAPEDLADEQLLEVLDAASVAGDSEAESEVEPDEDTCSCLDCRLPGEIEDDHAEDGTSELEHSSDMDESNQDNEHDSACPCRYMLEDPEICISDQINPDNLQSDDVEDSEEDELAADCLTEGCENDSCRTCCNDPKHFEEPVDLDKWRNVFTAGDHGDIDDEEHFDTDEQVGMLYEPLEPAVLLVSKEIRQQCLPIYYSQNAFSWRFIWTDYKRSCKRFKSWIKSISEENIKLITRITFQGRHVVEEGVEMSLDIDLLPYHPYFETNAYADEDHEIAEAMNRETAAYLWLMAQSERARPKLSVGHFCELANIFVQAMFRNGDGRTMEYAAALRLILSPLF